MRLKQRLGCGAPPFRTISWSFRLGRVHLNVFLSCQYTIGRLYHISVWTHIVLVGRLVFQAALRFCCLHTIQWKTRVKDHVRFYNAQGCCSLDWLCFVFGFPRVCEGIGIDFARFFPCILNEGKGSQRRLCGVCIDRAGAGIFVAIRRATVAFPLVREEGLRLGFKSGAHQKEFAAVLSFKVWWWSRFFSKHGVGEGCINLGKWPKLRLFPSN